jgi:hemerythrin-like domain-containing protein
MATPSMSMNKVIHCAVRRDLKRFRTALDSFQDGDKARAAGLHRAWENFDTQLTHHHEGEHEIAWPALLAVGVPQDSIARFDDEHDAMAAALAESRTAMGKLASSGSRADADVAASSMAKLEEVTVTHLDSEEQVSEPLFAEHHDHPAIKEMGKKFGKQPLGVAGTFFAWVQDGAGSEEMAALKAEVPAPVIALLPMLFGRGYRREVAPVWATSGSF